MCFCCSCFATPQTHARYDFPGKQQTCDGVHFCQTIRGKYLGCIGSWRLANSKILNMCSGVWKTKVYWICVITLMMFKHLECLNIIRTCLNVTMFEHIQNCVFLWCVEYYLNMFEYTCLWKVFKCVWAPCQTKSYLPKWNVEHCPTSSNIIKLLDYSKVRII